MTFARKRDAEIWLSTIEADRTRGVLGQPQADKRTLAEYAASWIENRPTILAANTTQNYLHLLENIILPELGDLPITEIKPETVRHWYAGAGKNSTKIMRANAYKLLSAMFNTMVADRIREYSPCTIAHGTKVESPQRVALSTDEVFALAENILPRYRALVMTAWLAGLRIGELLGLRRCDIDLEAGVITVEQQLQYIDGEWKRTETKTKKSQRTNHIPELLVIELRKHLADYVPEHGLAYVFTSTTGNHPSRNLVRHSLRRAAKRAGIETDLFPHLLRHSGLTLVAEAGATNAELLAFGGHTSMQVAMRYQHARDERMKDLAERVNGLVSANGGK